MTTAVTASIEPAYENKQIIKYSIIKEENEESFDNGCVENIGSFINIKDEVFESTETVIDSKSNDKRSLKIKEIPDKCTIVSACCDDDQQILEFQVKEELKKKNKEKKRKRNREYQKAWRQRQKDLKKKVSKILPKEDKEMKRKRHREIQRAYYYRTKGLKKNVEELSQKNSDDLQMKRKKLDSNEDQENVVQCRVSQNLENVQLQQNRFLTEQLRLYKESHECITSEVVLHRNTGIPNDGNCLFNSVIHVLQLQVSTCDLRRQIRDSPYIKSCNNPQEAYNILSTDNGYGDLDCLYLFANVYNQNVCVHYHYFKANSKNGDTRFCYFKANDTHNWIHLDLRELHFTPYFSDDEKKKEDERKRKQKNREYSKRYRDKKRTSNLLTGLSAKHMLDVQPVIHTSRIAGPATGGVPHVPLVICSSQIADLSSRDVPSTLSMHSN